MENVPSVSEFPCAEIGGRSERCAIRLPPTLRENNKAIPSLFFLALETLAADGGRPHLMRRSKLPSLMVCLWLIHRPAVGERDLF